MKQPILLTFFYVVISVAVSAQTTFSKVERFKLDGYSINVTFKDPLKRLVEEHPDFDRKDNQTKNDLLSYVLHNDTLYVFELMSKGVLQKSYVLIGNPEKAKMHTYFNLHVLGSDGRIEKNIDKVKVGGSFFEDMSIFQNKQGRKVIGKFIQIWGYFTAIEPYEKVKTEIVELIKKDLSNAISPDLLYQKKEPIEPLFDYQKWALAHVNKRRITTTVFSYDGTGQLASKDPRTEIDTSLYLASRSMEIGDVTNFPFFSAKDSTTTNGNLIQVNSTLENIRHYLKDVEVVINPVTKLVERIQGKLIIHGYSAEGHSTYDELYLAEFSPIRNTALPITVKYTSLDDKQFAKPRIVIKIEYAIK